MLRIAELEQSPTLSLFDFEINMAGKGVKPGLPKLSEPRRASFSRDTSWYWRVPDKAAYLTAVAAHPSEPLCAISSGSRENNLFIYEFSPRPAGAILTHHQTISLERIHSMQWVPPNTALGAQGNVLVSGHDNGLVHMTLLPDPHSSAVPAEILKRFNHRYHISDNAASMRVSQLALTSHDWKCTVPVSIATLCAETLFLWNPARSDTPVLKQRARGVGCFDLCNLRDGVVALGGRKGISIKDIREKASSGLSPAKENDSSVTLAKWAPTNDNLLASADNHNVVKVWDIRSTAPVYIYEGHSDKITSIEWSHSGSESIVSSSYDGTVRVWDIGHSCEDTHMLPFSREKAAEMWAQNRAWKQYQERCWQDKRNDMLALDNSTSLMSPFVSQSKKFADMRLTKHGAITVDQEGYFGYHELSDPSSPLSSASDSCDSDFVPPLSV